MTLFERIKNASPIVTRATLNKEIDRRIADAAYFKQVHSQAEQTVKKTHLRNDSLLRSLNLSQKAIQRLKKQLEEVILAKAPEQMQEIIDITAPQIKESVEKLPHEYRTPSELIKSEEEDPTATKSRHLAAIEAGQNWQAKDAKYQQVKEHFVNFKRQTASVVNKIKETPTPETMEQALGFFSAMYYAAEELESSGAYDPELDFDDIIAIYGSVENVPDHLLTDAHFEVKQKLIESES